MKKSMAPIQRLHGPIAIFGAGGFIGINLLNRILEVRSDVVGLSRSPSKSWRIGINKIPAKNIQKCNLLRKSGIKKFVRKYKPKTVFNLAAYGAYSWQENIEKIYKTNFNSTVTVIEALIKNGFSIYVHAGSQSEYGLNAAGPMENSELVPNSHYAVSKAACYHLLKYYGKVERLPVVHLRLYSVYGPHEDKKRLIPTLVKKARNGKWPNFVDAQISRDFIYIDDVVSAFLSVAAKAKKKHYGEVYNIATGEKTTMRELARIAKKLFDIKDNLKFGKIKKREWDVVDWYGNPKKMKKDFNWEAKIKLEEGLTKIYE